MGWFMFGLIGSPWSSTILPAQSNGYSFLWVSLLVVLPIRITWLMRGCGCCMVYSGLIGTGGVERSILITQSDSSPFTTHLASRGSTPASTSFNMASLLDLVSVTEQPAIIATITPMQIKDFIPSSMVYPFNGSRRLPRPSYLERSP